MTKLSLCGILAVVVGCGGATESLEPLPQQGGADSSTGGSPSVGGESGGSSTVPDCSRPAITDPALDEAVRRAASVNGPWTQEAWEGATTLRLSTVDADGVTSVEGLECFSAFRTLVLRTVVPADLDRLRDWVPPPSYRSSQSLRLADVADVYGLAALAGGVWPDELQLNSVVNPDLAPVSTLAQVGRLTIEGAGDLHLGALGGADLESLTVEGATVDGVEALLSMPRLVGLYFWDVTFVDPRAFGALDLSGAPLRGFYVTAANLTELPELGTAPSPPACGAIEVTLATVGSEVLSSTSTALCDQGWITALRNGDGEEGNCGPVHYWDCEEVR